jgi:hypothetical protein
MAPCDEQQAQTPLSQETGLRCAPQPPAASALVTGVGYYKSSRLQLIVVALESGLPSGSTTYVTDLLLGILSGTIH